MAQLQSCWALAPANWQGGVWHAVVVPSSCIVQEARLLRMQAVGSIVMGLRPEKMMDTDLKPRNLQTGATWTFPPTLLMAAGNDEGEILELINNTQAAMQTKVQDFDGPRTPSVLRLLILRSPARPKAIWTTVSFESMQL